MIKPTKTVEYLMVVFATVAMAANPPRGAPAPGPGCFSILIDMVDCLGYVENGSKLQKPDPPCCPEMSNMLNTNPVCLCKFLANSSQFDISDIDTSRALQLPSLCNVSAPPVKLCAVVGVPVPELVPSPSPAASSSTENEKSGTTKTSSPSSFKIVVGLSLVLFTSLFY